MYYSYFLVILEVLTMSTTITQKGQVTIPKQIRDALGLTPGSAVDFAADKDGNVILRKTGQRARTPSRKDRFEAARGKADIKWRTDELMALLRGED
jgi:AbrB family looped-hinge helix DNA binding protein